MSRALFLLAFPVCAAACAGSDGARDVVPPSRDVIANANSPSRRPSDADAAYEYVARRPGAVVALAEARGLAPAMARAAVEHVADSLASCASQRRRAGASADGAARIVAQVEPSGIVGAASLRIDPGKGAAESAVLCFVAPVKALVFDPVDAGAADGTGARGLAIEALWGSGGD